MLPLTRAVITALAFLSVSAALAAVPQRGLGFWHLYFAPVMIASLSFGLAGSFAGIAATVAAMLSMYYRFDRALTSIAPELLPEALRQSIVGILAMQATGDQFTQAVIGVSLLAGLGCMVGWLVDQNHSQRLRYEREATTDALTGVGNYRSLMEALSTEIARAGRFGGRIGFLMLDLDGLKPYNDTYGHQVGDSILRAVAQTLRHQAREVDRVCRYGGDEFAVVLLEATREGTRTAAERLRQAVALAVVPVPVGSVEARVTVSIGGCLYPDDGATPEELVAAADAALYEAKLRGKNQVQMAQVRTGPPAAPDGA